MTHQRPRLNHVRHEAVPVDRQNLSSGLHGIVPLAAGNLDLRELGTRQNVIGTDFDGLLELLASLFDLASQQVSPRQVIVHHRVLRRLGHHRLQLLQGFVNFAAIQHHGSLQPLGVIVLGVGRQNLVVDFDGFGLLALDQQQLDDSLLVIRLTLGIGRHAFPIFLFRFVEVVLPVVKIAHHQIGVGKIAGMGLDLVQHADHIVPLIQGRVEPRQLGQKPVLLGIILIGQFERLFGVRNLVLQNLYLGQLLVGDLVRLVLADDVPVILLRFRQLILSPTSPAPSASAVLSVSGGWRRPSDTPLRLAPPACGPGRRWPS